jgi:hypothetical protein
MAFPTTFQTPVSSGITPSGGIGAQLAAITRRAVVPTVFCQIYQSHPLLSLLFSNAQRAKGGVGQITVPVQGASFTQFSWGGFGGDFAMPQDQEAITSLQFNLKLGLVPIGFFGMEALVQASEVIIPKLRVVMSDAAVVMKKAFASAIYTNNTSNSQIIDSLPMAYDNGTNTTSYGGITRTGNPWINGQYYTNTAGLLTTRAGMATTLTEIATGAGGESPDFMVMNPANWAALMTDFMGYEQYQTRPRSIYGKDDVVNAGFRAIKVLDTPIFPDPYCPVGTAFAINSRYLSLYLSEYAPFAFSGFHSLIPLGQIADVGVLFSALDLICAKPSSGAWITGISNAAWNGPLATPAVV